jgi:Ran GTPase-activating protein (RanGAP) involved in mRNA processing and transport
VLAAALHPTAGHSSVTELDAGGNNLWGGGVGVAFADALRAPSCSLVTLDLQGCAMGDAGAAALTAALRAGSGLSSLGIGWNQLGTAASTALVEALQSPACGLTRLGHWRNNLCEAGGRAIAAALSSPHCCLTELDIGWNDIGHEAGCLIAEALVSPHCKLVKLIAGNNAFGPEAGLIFARRVVGSVTSRLQHLAIHMNGFGPAAGSVFAERIPLLVGSAGNCVLTELFLNSNALGADTLKLFSTHLLAATQQQQQQQQQQATVVAAAAATAADGRGGMSLLNLKDNGLSEMEAKALLENVQCVETLLL